MSLEDMIGLGYSGERCLACQRSLPGGRAFSRIKCGDEMLPLCCPLCLEAFQKNPGFYLRRRTVQHAAKDTSTDGKP